MKPYSKQRFGCCLGSPAPRLRLVATGFGEGRQRRRRGMGAIAMSDLTYSQTATGMGDPNTPDPSAAGNLVILLGILGGIYTDIGPFTIASGYRDAAVNEAVGGVPNSNHVIGIAADIGPTTMPLDVFFGRLLASPYANQLGEIAIKPAQNALHLSLATDGSLPGLSLGIFTPSKVNIPLYTASNGDGAYFALSANEIQGYIGIGSGATPSGTNVLDSAADSSATQESDSSISTTGEIFPYAAAVAVVAAAAVLWYAFSKKEGSHA